LIFSLADWIFAMETLLNLNQPTVEFKKIFLAKSLRGVQSYRFAAFKVQSAFGAFKVQGWPQSGLDN